MNKTVLPRGRLPRISCYLARSAAMRQPLQRFPLICRCTAVPMQRAVRFVRPSWQ